MPWCPGEGPERLRDVSRVICTFHWYRACRTCPHAEFTAVFEMGRGGKSRLRTVEDADDPWASATDAGRSGGV